MKGLAELVLSLCELAEAEGRALRQSVKRAGSGCLLIAIGMGFLAAALAFAVAAASQALARVLPPWGASLALSGLCLLIAVIVIWSGNKCAGRKPRSKAALKAPPHRK